MLRFDFAGIGDSEPRTDGLSPLDSSLADLGEVLDWLERERGISRVVLVGLCSGADHAILHAHSDRRVAALVLMDPSIPTTVRFYAQYILRHLTRLRSYISVVLLRSGLLRMWIGDIFYGLRSKPATRPASLEDLRFHNYLKQCYREAIDGGVRILAVFTGETTRQTYREQMFDAFPDIEFGDQLKLEFFEGTDHVFTSEKDRARLYEIVLDWMATNNRGQPDRKSLRPNRLAPASFMAIRLLSLTPSRSISCSNGWRVSHSPTIQPAPASAAATIASGIDRAPCRPAAAITATGPTAATSVAAALRAIVAASSSQPNLRKRRTTTSESRLQKGMKTKAAERHRLEPIGCGDGK